MSVKVRKLFVCALLCISNQSWSQAPKNEVLPKVSQAYVEVIQRAESAYLAKDHETAKALFTELVEKDPNLAFGWFRLGLVHQHQSQLNESLNAYSKVIQLSQAQQNTPELIELASKAVFNRAHIFMAMARNDFGAPLDQLDDSLKTASLKYAGLIERIQSGESAAESAPASCTPQTALVPVTQQPEATDATLKVAKNTKSGALNGVKGAKATKSSAAKADAATNEVQIFSGGSVKQ
jgi:tetratricopeptide (TPR) repeat protein